MTLPMPEEYPNHLATVASPGSINPADTVMAFNGSFQNLPKHLLIELAKNCMEIVRAILDLGVPTEIAQLFAKEFPQQFGERIGERVLSSQPTPHWLEDTCILIRHIENPSEADHAQMADQTWGWQETLPPLTHNQLCTALSHGAVLQHNDKGFDLFQRLELTPDQLHTLTQCVDVLALQPVKESSQA